MRPNIHSYSATPFISKSFTRSRFAVSYVCAIDSKFRIMQLIIQSYFAYIYIQIVHVISVRRVLGVCYWLYVWMHADEYSVVFCTPYIRESFTRSRFAMPYVYAIDSRFQIMQLNIHSYSACKIEANRSRDLGSPCPMSVLLILGFNSAECSFLFCTPYLSSSFTRSRFAVSYVHWYTLRLQSFSYSFTSILRRTEVAWTFCLLAR